MSATHKDEITPKPLLANSNSYTLLSHHIQKL